MLPLGETIQLWRMNKKLTQALLAARAGVSRPNLSAIEQGGRDMTVQTLRRIATALGVNAGTLADGVGPQTGAGAQRFDRFALDRIARLTAGQKLVASAEERRTAIALASLMKSKVRHARVKSRRLRSVRSENRTLLELKSTLGGAMLKHLIRRVEKNL